MNPGSYPILKVLMETSEEYKQAPGRQMYMLEELFDLGCRSPFLYLAAYEKMETRSRLSEKTVTVYGTGSSLCSTLWKTE